MNTSSNIKAAGHLCALQERNGSWWVWLDCGMGWFHGYAPEIQHRIMLEGNWVWAHRPINKHQNEPARLAWLADTHLAPPSWGPHISIVRGERLSRSAVSVLRDLTSGWPKSYTFEITDPEIHRAATKHYFLHIKSAELQELRRQFGLSPNPRVDWHLTLAVKGSS